MKYKGKTKAINAAYENSKHGLWTLWYYNKVTDNVWAKTYPDCNSFTRYEDPSIILLGKYSSIAMNPTLADARVEFISACERYEFKKCAKL